MYKAIYRTYRPEVFSDLTGQEHIVRILQNQIKEDKVNHAYLFSGTRGTGKTTTARLLAKAVNCLCEGEKPCNECENCKAINEGRFLDVIEIDAASYNGVDQIRELKSSIAYPPTQGKKKVYIIDEAHMLTKSAANALLKTLEEPPEWAMLILATTDPQKLTYTVRSRCMRLEFQRVSEEDIKKRIDYICQDRGVNIEESGVALIARNADGSLRDGLTILEQCIPFDSQLITRDMVLKALGTVDDSVFINIVDGILIHKPEKALMILEEALATGKDSRTLLNGLIEHYRNLLITKYVNKPEEVLNLSTENIERIKPQASAMSIDEITQGIKDLSQGAFDAKTSTQPRIILELVVMKLSVSLVDMNMSLDNLEDRAEKRKAYRKTIEESEPVEKDSVNIKGDTTKQAVKGEEHQPVDKDFHIDENVDVDRIWIEVIDAVSEKFPYVMTMKQTAKPIGIEGQNFVVNCNNEACEMIIKENQGYIENAMEQISGTKLSIKTETQGKVAKSDISGLKRNDKSDSLKGIDNQHKRKNTDADSNEDDGFWGNLESVLGTKVIKK